MALEIVERIAGQLAKHREVLKDVSESEEHTERVFEIAKQIRMVKIGLVEMEKEGLA